MIIIYNDLKKLLEYLDIDIEILKLEEEFKKNREGIIKEYLDTNYSDKISGYTDFIYYYIAENTNNYFYNYNSMGFIIKIKELLIKNNIILDFPYNEYLKKEEYYSELLIDIYITKLNFYLEKLNKKIIGINVGIDNTIYLILDLKEYYNIKKIKTFLFSIIDEYYFEKIYNEIYEIKTSNLMIEKGEFLIKVDDRNSIFKTLYNYKRENKEIILKKNEIEENLELII